MTIFFNALHAPIGAHASFTLGCRGAKGGLGLEQGKPADETIYVGVETREGGSFEALPFFDGAADESKRYDHAKKAVASQPIISSFAADAITRKFNLGEDTWAAGDLTFSIYSPVEPAPDPEKAPRALQMEAYCPSVLAELTIDNRQGKKPRKAFFGYLARSNGDKMRWFKDSRIRAVFCGQQTGIACDDPSVTAACRMRAEGILTDKYPENFNQGLGGVGLLMASVPAGKIKTFRFAICFYRGGIVTTGLPTSYWYTRFFKDIEAVAKYSLQHAGDIKRRAVASQKLVASRKLNDAQRFQMIHAIRAYYGSTQLLDHKGKPLWVVNEGEYRMMNTFDLTVDQLFFEMKLNPWTVRNELDLFVSRYSYMDRVHFPGEDTLHPGGISFTHDMGCRNHFSPKGYSSYERFGLSGCFSHMTHEQLVNWVLCAAVYAKGSGDTKWEHTNLPVYTKCLKSMLNRDNPRAAARNGVMSLDSSRTKSGAEITTYDILDESLGQARNNVYMAVKGWAAYIALEEIFTRHGLAREASMAAEQARRAADTIAGHMTPDGYIPAIMGEKCKARIIPAIEGLVFPYVLGQMDALRLDGPYGHLVRALKKHLDTVLRKGICLYPDNGWKLSDSADNAWLSKIYLCQFVARKVLGVKTPETGKLADEAHQAWLLKPENLYQAWSDQMSSGVAKASKYYPRGVTSILWLEE